MNWIRSRNRWANPVSARVTRPPRTSCSTPPSKAVERSGRRSGFPVTNPLAKFSKKLGSLNAFPTDALRRVVRVAKPSALIR